MADVILSSKNQIVIPREARKALRLKAKEKVNEVLNSMSHGTGRAMSRSDCKPLADATRHAGQLVHSRIVTLTIDWV